ncbi:transcriptional repressor TraM [Novosphingobium resinovorum]|uniref:transcriptional repressor TraM n=1 Tax=Novosphingobium resinovorum TaxID=158500 RepID=UPI0009F73411
MPKNRATSSSRSEELSVVTEWSKCELEALVADGIVRYRAAAATAQKAHNRWRRFVGAGNEAEYSIRLVEYRRAHADCEAHRVALNHLIDQLGYIPTVATSTPSLHTESQ